MATFTFTGTNGVSGDETGFDFFDDIDRSSGGLSFQPNAGLDTDRLVKFSATNAAHTHFVSLAIADNGLGRAFITGIDAGQAQLVATGFRVPFPALGSENFSTQADAVVADFMENLFAGDDDFTITGTVSSVWGDFKTVPRANMELGDDFLTLKQVTTANGAATVVVYGDAQTAAAGAIAGDDVIDGLSAGTALTVFGDFLAADGSVTYGNDTIYGSNKADRLFGDSPVSGDLGGDDFLKGGDGDDQLFGGGGNDFLGGGQGGDFIDGGAGFDFATYNREVTPLGLMVVDMENASLNTGLAAGDTLVNIEGLMGTDFSSDVFRDDLRGDEGDNILMGLRGEDTLTGRGGNDQLFGGAGNDILIGGEGRDLLDGGTGDDIMRGGAGNDTYIVDSRTDVIEELAGEGIDTVRTELSCRLAPFGEVENLNLLGNDAINGVGNDLDNVITGNGANNVLNGGGGKDRLIGGRGIDGLIGGLEADTFVFAAGDTGRTSTTADTIRDFRRGQGDKIDLSAIDADTTTSGNQAFIFIGSESFHHVAGELCFRQINGTTFLFGDTNGDGRNDLALAATGTIAYQAGDFIL